MRLSPGNVHRKDGKHKIQAGPDVGRGRPTAVDTRLSHDREFSETISTRTPM